MRKAESKMTRFRSYTVRKKHSHTQKDFVVLLPLILPDISKIIYFLIKEIQALAVLTYISSPIPVRLL